MVEHFAAEAVVLRAERALKLIAFFTVLGNLVKDECVLAVRAGTPRQIFLHVYSIA